MKVSSGFFAVLLVLWSGGSTYWYVCKIKKDCEKNKIEKIEKVKKQNIENTPPQQEQTVKKDTLNIVNEISEKLKNGYTLDNFPLNSDNKENIEASFYEFAENLKIYLEKNGNIKVMITGYTDNTGTFETNIKVGKKRAEFCKSKLVASGIEESKILTSSEGQKNPVADNKTEEGRKKNRRVVIEIINK